MVLTKQGIAEQFQPDLGFTKQPATETVESLPERIKASLESGEDALVSGLVRFCLKATRERKGRNPSTGGKMMSRPRRVMTFKCSGQLQAKINTR